MWDIYYKWPQGKRWCRLGEGPWRTKEAAERFGRNEVGAPYVVRKMTQQQRASAAKRQRSYRALERRAVARVRRKRRRS